MQTTQAGLTTTSNVPLPAGIIGAQPPLQRRKEIHFDLVASDAQAVSVAGTFNQWDPKRTPMKKSSANHWKTSIPLAPGRYEYRFVVDGRWLSDPEAKQSVRNPYGSTNSVLRV